MKTVFSALFASTLVLAGAVVSTSAAPAATDDKVQKIEELLELTGSGDLGVQVMEGMLAQMKQALPDVPAEWWSAFMDKVDPQSLNALVVPIYEKHFSDEEIDAMLTFYRTPAGQSVVSKLPVIMQESMVAGQTWGEQLMKDVIGGLEEDGYKLPPGLDS